MSQELIKARKTLTQVRTNLKMKKYYAAARSLYDALFVVLSTPLIKHEREEFEQMVSDQVRNLSSDPGIKQLFPLQITYTPGQERELLDVVKTLMETLEAEQQNEAKSALDLLEAKKQNDLERARQLIAKGRFDEAKQIYDTLIGDLEDSSDVKAEAGDQFLKAERYEEAYEYLAQALKDDPTAIHLYNRIAIALRKMGKFHIAEKYFARALKVAPHDAHLYFNIGRLYIDCDEWDKVAKAAQRALKCNPDFVEAGKMLAFAKKKMAAQG